MKILIVVKESAGDVFIITSTIDSLHTKYPDAHIYVACDPQYKNILDGNKQIKGVIPFHESMYNYKAYGKWCIYDNTFDIVYCPTICTQVVPSNWLNGKYATFLGTLYANMCNVPLGKTFISEVDISRFNLPDKYITLQGKSGQEVKDYSFMKQVVERITGFPVVQLGAANEKVVAPNVINLCGQTTYQEAATIIKGAILHVGLDSVLMHFAAHHKTRAVVLFGGTTPQAAIGPDYKSITVIETPSRTPCIASCHLHQCEAKRQFQVEKCIDRITVDDIVEVIGNVIGVENVVPPEPVKISSYMIIKDGIKYGFPFEESIGHALKVSDEVVVVDGGSTDGTWERLQVLQQNSPSFIKVFQHQWDMDNPTLFGDEKTYARKLCTGNWLIQLDADEIIREPRPGYLRELITENRNLELIDLPVINMYGSDDTTRIEEHCWKWRISKNNPNIIHGVYAEARQFDSDSMRITMDKKKSDGCEYIYSDSLKIVPHVSLFPRSFAELHYKIRQEKQFEKHMSEYMQQLDNLMLNSVIVFHYSWYNLNRKKNNGEFWDSTFHGKKNATHNTTEDIGKRIKENQNGGGELIVFTPIDHPLKAHV